MATKARQELTLIDQTDATAIVSWYRTTTGATPSAPTTTSASATPSGWSRTEPTVASSADLANVAWRCEQLVWGDGSCSWGEVTQLSAYDAAKVAYNKALAAAQTATNYVTEITGGGIMVHPSGDANSGWKIADALELIKSTVTAFSVALVSGMAKVIVGEADKSHAEIDYHSLQMVDKDGETYFHVSDLRDASGYMEDVFPARAEAQSRFQLRASVTGNPLVKVGGAWTFDFVVNSSTGDTASSITLSNATTEEVVVSYMPNANSTWKTKAYTIGTRGSGAVGMGSVVEGNGCNASGLFSRASGRSTSAIGNYSSAEGQNTTAGDSYMDVGSHAEGVMTSATGNASHAEGFGTNASGQYSHAEGNSTNAGFAAHAEGGDTEASEAYSHAQNHGTIAASESQTVMGKYNAEDASDVYALIIGNGTGIGARSNAFMVSWAGDVHCTGGPDRDETPSSTATGPGYRFKDALDQTIGRVFPRHNADANSVVVEAMREVGGTMKYGQLYVGVTPAGDPWYYVNGKEAFRETLGLGRTQSNLTLSNTSAGTVTLVRNAIAATVMLTGVKLSSALANGSSVQIATVPSGYRPAAAAHTLAYMNTNGFPHGVDVFVNTAGAVTVMNRSGASLGTSYNIYALLTYVI